MRHGEVKGRPLMCATNSHMHANERLFFFPPQDISCRVLARGRQQRLNSGISWTQHWRFGLCLHKGEGRGCKLFTGECRVTALCACLYMRPCWSVDVCLECNNVASAMGQVLSDWDVINKNTVPCVRMHTFKEHTLCTDGEQGADSQVRNSARKST